jgi:hypothetical protein
MPVNTQTRHATREPNEAAATSIVWDLEVFIRRKVSG